MNKQKLTYVSPETETLVVRFEESVLQGGSPGSGENVKEQETWSGSNGWS